MSIYQVIARRASPVLRGVVVRVVVIRRRTMKCKAAAVSPGADEAYALW